MMETAGGRPLVRPRFLFAAAVIFILLLPLVFHAAWDYAESWRLRRNVERIRERGERVTAAALPDLSGEAGRAERLLRAAAALSGGDGEGKWRAELYRRVEDASRDGRWPGDLVALLRTYVAEHRDVLDLLDRAAALPFAGFQPGAIYNYLTSDLLTAGRIVAFRTRVAALDANAEAAAASAFTELRLLRVFDHTWMIDISRPLASVAAVLDPARIDAASLARLDAALRELDRDDLMTSQFMQERAAVLDLALRPARLMAVGDLRVPTVEEWLVRPWVLQISNRRIEALTALVEVVARPWPRKLDPLTTPHAWDNATEAALQRADLFKLNATARVLAGVRCARAAVAITRFRQDRHQLPAALDDVAPQYIDRVPVDPFTGTAMKYTIEQDAFAVTSFGSNRRDPNGRLRPLGIQVRTR